MLRSKVAAAAGALALVVSLAACGSSDSDEDGSSSEASTATPEMQKALEAAYEGIGGDLSNLTPVAAQSGLRFRVMSCGEQLGSCHTPAEYMVEAAKALGWDAKILDGKLNPDGFATAIRQAIADNADVLVPVGISCSAAAQAFKEAHDAGITIVGGGGVDDCDPKAWASERLWLEDPPVDTFFHGFGYLDADYAYGKLGDDVKAMSVVSTTNVWAPWIADGFFDQLEALGAPASAEVKRMEVTDADTSDTATFNQKVVTELLAHPEVNTLIVQTDSYLQNGLAAAIDQAGLSDKILVIGNFADPGSLDMIRSGAKGIDATVGLASGWEAWGSVDTALRMLAGQPALYIGQSMQVIDAGHNLPDSGGYEGSVDYRAKFKAAWGIS